MQRRASRLKSHAPQDPGSGARSSRQRLRTQGSTPSRLDICNTSATPSSRSCWAAHPICPHPQKQVWEESGWQKVRLVRLVGAQPAAGCVLDLLTSHPARKRMSLMDVGTGPPKPRPQNHCKLIAQNAHVLFKTQV